MTTDKTSDADTSDADDAHASAGSDANDAAGDMQQGGRSGLSVQDGQATGGARASDTATRSGGEKSGMDKQDKSDTELDKNDKGKKREDKTDKGKEHKEMEKEKEKEKEKDKDKGKGKGKGKDKTDEEKNEKRKKGKEPKNRVTKTKGKASRTGSPKAIETMYRNAYRAELDMIALAATKANIMISLNGFIISVLMVSGGFIYASSPLFLLPATLFLFTSAISVYFALLAASPEQIGKLGRVVDWARAVITRRARVGDFKHYVQREEAFDERESNVLIYEDRAKLTQSEYRRRMRTLRGNTEQVYDRMSDQLYWLGQIASTKFRMLGASHGVFRWGLVLSVISFLSIKSIDALLILDGDRVVQLRNVGVLRFRDIYEPSATAQLPDGRVLIVEDEPERALNILAFRADGSLSENPSVDTEITASLGRELSDLEGLAIDTDDYIYAITSHSTNTKGQRVAAREELARFRIEGDKAIDIGFHSTLRDELSESEVLREAIRERIGRSVDVSDINIEGLAYDAEARSLLVGFREPTVDGLSLIVTIGNPAELFEASASPEFTDVALLDLEGGGVRSLNFDPVLDTYLLVNEVRTESGEFRPHLWSWSGDPEAAPEEMNLPGMIDLTNVESLDSITVNRNSRLLISSDDGKIKEGRGATYMLLEHDQLWRKGPPDTESP